MKRYDRVITSKGSGYIVSKTHWIPDYFQEIVVLLDRQNSTFSDLISNVTECNDINYDIDDSYICNLHDTDTQVEKKNDMLMEKIESIFKEYGDFINTLEYTERIKYYGRLFDSCGNEIYMESYLKQQTGIHEYCRRYDECEEIRKCTPIHKNKFLLNMYNEIKESYSYFFIKRDSDSTKSIEDLISKIKHQNSLLKNLKNMLLLCKF